MSYIISLDLSVLICAMMIIIISTWHMRQHTVEIKLDNAYKTQCPAHGKYILIIIIEVF